MKRYLVICIISIGFLACEKEAGEGGTSVIDGRIIYFTTSYNTQTSVTDTHYYPKAGKDVFIIYSDDEDAIYDDKFETDWEGRYHFEFLRKGDYTIFTHVDSIVINDVTYDYPIFKHISITNNNSINTLSDFVIHK